MSLKAVFNSRNKVAKLSSLLVICAVFCYSAQVFSHPLPEPPPASGAMDMSHWITIELAEVASLDSVASFTKLLAENPSLSDLHLKQVQLKVDQPGTSFVRWAALVTPGTLNDLELDLQGATGAFEGLTVVHRRSYRDFISFVMAPVVADSADSGVYSSAQYDSLWSIDSGRGFD